MTTLACYPNGATNTSAQDAWLGTPFGGMLVFAGDQTSDSLAASEANWAINQLGSYKGDLMVSIQLIPDQDAGKLAQAAAGSLDAAWAAMAQKLVAVGQGKCWVRPGWEFNGGWYAWAPGASAANQANYVKAFQRFVTVFRANGFTGRVVWCTACGQGQENPETCYPGDAYVDAVGSDVYISQGAVFAWMQLQPYGLNWLASFAKAHSKAIVIPEWGVMDDTQPGAVTDMAAWFKANNVAWAGYWMSDDSAACSLMSASKPKSAAAFKAAFGAPATPAQPAAPVKPVVPAAVSKVMDDLKASSAYFPANVKTDLATLQAYVAGTATLAKAQAAAKDGDTAPWLMKNVTADFAAVVAWLSGQT